MSTATDIGKLVTCSPDIDNSRPTITGTETSVRRVVVLYKEGASAEEEEWWTKVIMSSK
jgi:uncharacterized protein (DUF433 family)